MPCQQDALPYNMGVELRMVVSFPFNLIYTHPPNRLPYCVSVSNFPLDPLRNTAQEQKETTKTSTNALGSRLPIHPCCRARPQHPPLAFSHNSRPPFSLYHIHTGKFASDLGVFGGKMASKLTLIRRRGVQQSRAVLYELPSHQLLEVPGRPHVVYEIRDYSREADPDAQRARRELPFLFRPFEAGQKPPPKVGSREADLPRESTIHEYLNWTVTARPVVREENLDFSGFRVIVLLPRLRPNWPAPGAYQKEAPRACQELGGPRNPLPCLMTNSKAICAATIRCGRGYLEVPFFATKETRRGRGFGRCLLEAIEAVGRAVGVTKLLLCSTDDEATISTWKHLGFRETSNTELDEWGICSGDLLHMTNTVQMVKDLDMPCRWKSLIVRHQHFVQRVYYPGQTATPQVGWKQKYENHEPPADSKSDLGKESRCKRSRSETDFVSVEDTNRTVDVVGLPTGGVSGNNQEYVVNDTIENENENENGCMVENGEDGGVMREEGSGENECE